MKKEKEIVNHLNGRFAKGHTLNRGKNNPMYGKRLSEEHRRKISNSLKGRKATKSCFQKGEKHWNWNNGKTFAISGHILIYRPNHPYALNGKYVPEHRLIAEKVLGKYLEPHEIVHHINGDPKDNRNCNLLVCSRGYHRWLHAKMIRGEIR